MPALRPRPVFTACSTQYLLMTGSIPGIAASTSETWLFGSPPKAVEAPEKSFALDVTWAWTSKPITTSHSPVSPLRSLDFCAFAMAVFLIVSPAKATVEPFGTPPSVERFYSNGKEDLMPRVNPYRPEQYDYNS